MKMITYQDNERIVTEIAHPQDAGFTTGKTRVRHTCGKFATIGTKPYQDEKGIYRNLSVYRCLHCDVTVIGD